MTDRAYAILSFVLPLAAFVPCVPAFPAAWDTAEMQTAPYVLGIPHPTGFPVLMLAGWLFSHVFAFGTVAWRLNLFSAVAIAGTSSLVYRTARLLGARGPAAVLGGLIFALGDVVWSKATQIDVHAFAIFWTALAVTLAIGYVKTGESRMLYGAALANGFGLATHPNTIWTIPALAFVFVSGSRRSWRVAAAAAACLAAPLALYAYLPLRSLAFAAAGGDPAETLPVPAGMPPFSIVWDTNQPRTPLGFLHEVLASNTGAPGALTALFHLFEYPAFAAYWWSAALPEFGVLAIVLAVAGAAVLLARNQRGALALLVAGFCGVPYAVAYAPNEADVSRYFLASFFVISVFASLGPELVLEVVPAARGRLATASGVLATLLLATSAALLAYPHRDAVAAAHGGSGAQTAIEDALHDTPSNAIILTAWYDATSLAYGEDVEGELGDRIVVANGPDSLESVIPAWSRMRPVYVFSDWIIEPEIAPLPPGWVTERPNSDPQHHIYQLCANARAC